ncbi:MAG: tRNA-dihydrouridine synthase family protein [Desulfobacterales bacterium]|nr:tRNA-dihydrouridine synthase family protein [Desulfobacterales bacterium]
MDVTDSASLAQYLNTPLAIGQKTIPNRMVLAPMAGLGHIAFRELVDDFGGFGLLFTGMCSARAVPHENPKVSPVFSWREEELNHTVCQIFGSTPEEMARAAKRVDDEGFFGVDLNFGCSVAAICKKGCGAALLKTPDLGVQVVEAVRRAVNCPVFVKYRTGWEDNPEFAVAMGKRFQEAGADALTFHPRVAPDRRSRKPRWEIIGQLVEAVDIPVFGNGNLFEQKDGIKMVQTTGCQGLSLGRMAVARPWIFSQWSQGMDPKAEIYLETALSMLSLLAKHYDDHLAVKYFKKLAPYFCANFKFSQSILKKMMKATTLEEMTEKLHTLLDPVPETLSRPNLTLFV